MPNSAASFAKHSMAFSTEGLSHLKAATVMNCSICVAIDTANGSMLALTCGSLLYRSEVTIAKAVSWTSSRALSANELNLMIYGIAAVCASTTVRSIRPRASILI